MDVLPELRLVVSAGRYGRQQPLLSVIDSLILLALTSADRTSVGRVMTSSRRGHQLQRDPWTPPGGWLPDRSLAPPCWRTGRGSGGSDPLLCRNASCFSSDSRNQFLSECSDSPSLQHSGGAAPQTAALSTACSGLTRGCRICMWQRCKQP